MNFQVFGSSSQDSSPPEGSTEASADGWSRVVLGRPSGGVPHGSNAEDALESDARENLQAAAPDGAHPAAAPGTKIPSKDPPAAELDAEVTVQAGQTLSEICRERYGTASLDLVQAVARYNHLTGPDAIREGQRILLPATEKMRE